jgi:anti-sigma regulatory factor (Ser/Thr protein kinase)
VAEQARSARRWVAGLLRDGHPAVDDCVLLVSETFTNAVCHSGSERVEVSVFADGQRLAVEVVDGGGDALPHRVDDPAGESGRGLPILEALTDDRGYQVLGDGRLCVWFSL